MIVFKEEGAVCLDDGKDVIVFPLKKEELDLLLEVGNKVFSNYIGVEYDGDDVWAPDFLKVANLKLDILEQDADFWELNTIWLIVSAKHKKIVGDFYFKSLPIDGRVEIEFRINPKYYGQNITLSAVSLITDWAFENSVNCLSVNCNEQDDEIVKALKCNNFKKIKANNQICNYEKNKIIKFERDFLND